jgi:hypothetical protein
MITTLTAKQLMCKTYGRDFNSDYGRAYMVQGHQHQVHDLVDLYDLLEELESDPYRCVVRGRPIKPGTWVRRTYREESEPGFLSQELDWLCLDIDGAQMPDEADMHMPWKWVGRYLPAPLHRAGVILQWSSSAGLKPGVRAHLWCLLDRPVADKSLKAWVKSLGGFDAGLYQPVQPHYTARPLFDGVDDPLRQRLFMRQGPRAQLPDEVCGQVEWDRREGMRIERELQAQAKRGERELFTRARELQCKYERAALRRACEAIRAALEGERHDTIRKEAWATWRFVVDGRLDEHVWYDVLYSAGCAMLPARRHGEVERLLQGAKKTP